MKKTSVLIVLTFFLGLISFYSFAQTTKQIKESQIISYVVNPTKQMLDFYLKDPSGNNYGSIENLKTSIAKKQKKLLFAMNGGMYLKDGSPQGLYIEKGNKKTPLDSTPKGYGNFYMQPNGVFYITKNNIATICPTSNFKHIININYATQSGPMLVIDGKLHPKFKNGSTNLHIRNGVGVLSNGQLLFAMSKERINFYDFASYFKQHGCKNALYLDGFVSRTYLPSKNWIQLDGDFGVIIGVCE